MTTNGLTEFKQVVADFRSVGSLALKGSVLIPLANLWARIGPPPTIGVAIISALTQLVVLILVFHFCQGVSAKRLSHYLKIAFFGLCLGGVMSFALSEFFTMPRQGGDPVVIGFRLRPEMGKVLGPLYTTSDALRDGQFDPTQVWTRTSVQLMQFLLPTIWVTTFGFLAAYLAVFVMARRRR